MNAQKYTQKSLEAIQAAQQLTIENQNQQIEQVHLLASLIRQENGLAPQLLRKMGVTVESLDAAVLQELGKLPRVTGSGREADRYYVARPVDEALNRAEKLADEMKDDFVSVEHLLLALIETADSTLKRLFSAYNITKERFLQALQSVRGNQRVTPIPRRTPMRRWRNTAPILSSAHASRRWTPSSVVMRKSET